MATSSKFCGDILRSTQEGGKEGIAVAMKRVLLAKPGAANMFKKTCEANDLKVEFDWIGTITEATKRMAPSDWSNTDRVLHAVCTFDAICGSL